MAGDYSKNGVLRERRVTTVLMQQGRVTLDSDHNEQGEVLDRRIRNLAHDAWGRSWVPALTTPQAFALTAIAGPDLAIGAGRLYAFGLAPEVFPGETPTWQKQPFLPVPQALPSPGLAIAYLDVFEREITWVEDRELLEKALQGVDTATRRQVLWQVKLASQPNASCRLDLDALFPASQGRLTTDATGTPTSDDPCILPPTGGYRGLENRLYRVQVHVPGPPGTARFKWSRENASVVSPVESITVSGTKSQLVVPRIGRDAVLRFAIGEWVEVSDDWRDLLGQAGDMARIENIEETTRTIFLDRVVPASGTFATDAAGHKARHTRLIRWDQSQEKHGNAVDPVTGLMTGAAFPIGLEDGVQVGFVAAPGTAGAMNIGDHWSFAARTVDGSVQQLNAAAPDGIRHFRVPLAVVTVGAGGITVDTDCRNLVPTTGGGGSQPAPTCECCTVCVGREGEVPDLQTALDVLPNLAPDTATAVRICLLPGDHAIPDGLTVTRPNTRIVGCFPRARILVRGTGLVFAAASTGIEEVVIIGAADRGMVAFRGVEDGFVRSCWFQSQRGGPFAVAAERSSRLIFEDNRFEGAGIGLLGGCSDLRIERNAVERFAGSAIAIEARESRDIAIRHNRLADGQGCGIEVAGLLQRLAIIDNEVTTCRGERNLFGAVAGGIVVLEAIEDLIIRDNRIEANASDGRGSAAGIYIEKGAAVEITRNRITGNGNAEVEGQPLCGGIVIASLRPHLDPDANNQHRFDPALIVTENVVSAPRGQALYVIGEGDIRVQGNTLISQRGVARSAGPNDLGARDIASVILIGTQRLDGLAEKLIVAGADGALAPRTVIAAAEENRAIAPGRVLLQDNQIALEQQRAAGRDLPTLSAVAVYGFTDVDLARNQVELEPNQSLFCVDTLVVAQTTRQQGNRLAEGRAGALASLLSLGFSQNSCAQNQGSHCILPFGPTQLIDRDNLVEFPSPLCPNG